MQRVVHTIWLTPAGNPHLPWITYRPIIRNYPVMKTPNRPPPPTFAYFDVHDVDTDELVNEVCTEEEILKILEKDPPFRHWN